eukprot:26396_1
MPTLRVHGMFYLLYTCVIVHFTPTTSITYHGSIQIPANDSFRLNGNDEIWSTTNTSLLTLETGGNLVFRRYTPSHHKYKTVWFSKTPVQNDNIVHYVEISSDGNIMVIEDKWNTILWQSNTLTVSNTLPLELVINDNCPYLYDNHMDIVWSPCNDCNDDIPIEFKCKNYDESTYLSLTNVSIPEASQVNGDLWQTQGTSAIYAEFNHNGNIMLKDASDTIQWESRTENVAQLPLILGVNDDCVYLRNTYQVIWQNGTCMKPITTLSPSIYPQISPTVHPSDIPSTSSTVSTANPTVISPSTHGTLVFTEYSVTKASVFGAVDHTESKENYLVLMVILSSITFCICGVALIMFLYKTKETWEDDFPPITEVNSTSANAVRSNKREAIVLAEENGADDKVTCEGSGEYELDVHQEETGEESGSNAVATCEGNGIGVSKTPGNMEADEFEVIGDDEAEVNGEDHYRTTRY